MAEYKDYVQLCVDDLTARVKAVVESGVESDVLSLYSQDNLLGLANGKVKLPALAVVYSGTVPIQNAEKQGLFANIRVDIFIIISTMGEQTEGVEANSGTGNYTAMLGEFRQSMRKAYSPTQMPWEFRGEVPYEFESNGDDSKVGYIQSWATKVNFRDL